MSDKEDAWYAIRVLDREGRKVDVLWKTSEECVLMVQGAFDDAETYDDILNNEEIEVIKIDKDDVRTLSRALEAMWYKAVEVEMEKKIREKKERKKWRKKIKKVKIKKL